MAQEQGGGIMGNDMRARGFLDNSRAKHALAFLKENRTLVFVVAFVTIGADILFIANSSDIRTFGMLALYAIGIRFYRLKSRVTYVICLGLLGIMFVEFLLAGPSVATEKAAVWLVLFLAVGIFQQWRE